MRTLGKIAATLGVIGAIAASSTVPAAAWYGYHHRYYHHHYGYHHHPVPSSLLRLLPLKEFEAASTGGLLFRVIDFAADLSPFARRQVYRTARDCLEDTASLLAKPQRQKTESLRQSSQAVRRCTERRHWRLVARSCQAAHICREVPP